MKPHEFRDLIASYVDVNYGPRGVVVYTEVSLGKTIIGKNRKLDVFVLRKADQRALAIEAKYQEVQGTTDEKIPYALHDLEALWIPGCLVYAGPGWSKGVLHTLEGSRRAVHCLPERPALARTHETRELDHVLAAVFGFWDQVIPEERLFSQSPQLSLLKGGPRKAEGRAADEKKRVVDDDR
ncbi:MAG: PD-(D/E)XK nuclease superfamily protein [Polyangiaceae bacterium]